MAEPGTGGNDYTYSNNGNRLTNTISDNTGPLRTETYGYDELSRLTSANYGDGQTQGYTFDAMGNRLTKTDNVTGNETYTVNAANMLLTRNGNAYTNDTNGSTLTGGGRTNTWDGQNLLTQCVFGSATTSHTYGGDGLRRRTVQGANTTDFILDGQSVVRTFLNGAVDKTFLHGPRGPEYERTGAGDPLWNLYDGLGSVTGTVDAAGNVVSARKYDVYGAVRGLSGPSGTKHKFVGSLGHPSEDDTGLIYMRARYYDPTTGTFISEDRARDGGNWYMYASNCPTRVADADGGFALGDLSLTIAIGEGVVSAGFDAILQSITTGQIDLAEVGAAFGVGALGGMVGHYFRWLHYARTPIGRRVWNDAQGSFKLYFNKLIGIGAGNTEGQGKLFPLWRSLTSGAGTRLFSCGYNSYLAGYLDD